MDGLQDAIEAFQRSSGLAADAQQLSASFWQQLVVPVKPGDSTAAALALRWLLRSTSKASRPPLWDDVEVEQHCNVSFDASLQAELLSALSPVNVTEGVPLGGWLELLQLPEKRASHGCLYRALVARSFGLAWVLTWMLTVACFVFGHVDGWSHWRSGNGRWLGQVPRNVHEVALIGAMMLSHSLAGLGIWSLPVNLLSQIFIGVEVTAAAVLLLRLAAKRGVRCGERSFLRYLEMALFVVLSMLVYCLRMLVPFFQAFGPAPRDLKRWARGGLFFVMSILAAAMPMMLALCVGTFGTTGFWIGVFTPSFLFLLSVVADTCVGRLIEARCEYTAETNWLLSLLFRFFIEQVRFNTALAVLLLALVKGKGFGPFVLHLVQTLVFAILLRRPSWSAQVGDGSDRSFFNASQIVSRTGSRAVWPYRSEAAVLPCESALYVTHLFQLLFLGLPVGVSAGDWWGGLVLLLLFAALRETISVVLCVRKHLLFPEVPWSALPGPLVALVAGAAVAIFTLAQAHFYWLLYAHHWAVCYVGTGMEVAEDSDVTAGVLLGIWSLLLLAAHVYSFLLWSVWMRQVKMNRRAPTQKQVQAFNEFKRSASMNLDDRRLGPTLVRVNSLNAAGVKPLFHSEPAPAAEEEVKELGRTWDQTLNTLWDDDQSEMFKMSTRWMRSTLLHLIQWSLCVLQARVASRPLIDPRWMSTSTSCCSRWHRPNRTP
ncbi:unnamed protein product [Effrenium voratum]|nr:unnamed protein product [Effrenium voratum]